MPMSILPNVNISIVYVDIQKAISQLTVPNFDIYLPIFKSDYRFSNIPDIHEINFYIFYVFQIYLYTIQYLYMWVI